MASSTDLQLPNPRKPNCSRLQAVSKKQEACWRADKRSVVEKQPCCHTTLQDLMHRHRTVSSCMILPEHEGSEVFGERQIGLKTKIKIE